MDEYPMSKLARASGFPERTIRQYIREGFLPRPPYHGSNTVYSDVHLVRLRAIDKLRETPGMSRLERLRAWFSGKTQEQIAAFVNGAPPPTPAAPTPASFAGERWVHVALVPGMQLLVRDDASPVVARLAEEIRAKYSAK